MTAGWSTATPPRPPASCHQPAKPLAHLVDPADIERRQTCRSAGGRANKYKGHERRGRSMGSSNKPVSEDMQVALLQAFGADTSKKLEAKIDEWEGSSYPHSLCRGFKFVVIEHGPKSVKDVKARLQLDDEYVALMPNMCTILFKSGKKSRVEILGNNSDYNRILTVATGSGIIRASNEVTLGAALDEIIDTLPKASDDFVNPGMFSPHYLRTRLDDNLWSGVNSVVENIRKKVPHGKELFAMLGWKKVTMPGIHKINSNVTVIMTPQDDLSLKVGDKPAPSSTAVASLRDTPWVILTNGVNWRLYTNKIAAVTTDYFQVNYNPQQTASLKYLVAIFASRSYDGDLTVNKFLEGSTTYAKELEKNLQSTITDRSGPFFSLVMGVLGHDSDKHYSKEELDEAKEAALRAMYRMWFVLYAESRDLLPVKDDRYNPISFQSIRARLDSYEADPEAAGLWKDMLKLFTGMRNGSPDHNLPQYNGGIFAEDTLLDRNMLKNKFVVKAFRSLVENDGIAVDYASLGVRNIGSVYEALIEIAVRQSDKDIMVYEEQNGEVRTVNTKEESNYTYKKGDLYLVRKGGLFSRKNTGSYYTPEKFVQFLVKRALDPILAERTKIMSTAVRAYVAGKRPGDRQRCIDTLLNLRVIDPAMGSGHFLVEVLNQLTSWATTILAKYPDHPVWDELKADRNIVLATQHENNIEIDKNLLKHETLLKRRIMKQCIYGVDLNYLAVELAKFSLWLDSFAIGVPLTYMDHHLKVGDSTIGTWLNDVGERENQYLDTWQDQSRLACEMLSQVSQNSDITAAQVHQSAKIHKKYETDMLPRKIVLDVFTAAQMNKSIIPKNVSDKRSYAERFGITETPMDKSMLKVRDTVHQLSKKYHFFHWELEFLDVFTAASTAIDVDTGGGEETELDSISL